MSASLCGRSSIDTTTACPTHSGIKDGIKIFSPQKQKSKSSKGVVWYSSFWSEGPKNHRNLKILVSKFVPRGFEARRTWGFEEQHHGVSRGGAGVSRHRLSICLFVKSTKKREIQICKRAVGCRFWTFELKSFIPAKDSHNDTFCRRHCRWVRS